MGLKKYVGKVANYLVPDMTGVFTDYLAAYASFYDATSAALIHVDQVSDRYLPALCASVGEKEQFKIIFESLKESFVDNRPDIEKHYKAFVKARKALDKKLIEIIIQVYGNTSDE